MTKPVLLDAGCKAGGASMGYHRAGFEVYGCDVQPQPRYPFHPSSRHLRPTSTKNRRAALDSGHNISVTGDVGRYVGPPCLGIDWMTGDELSQAIPPAYTEHIGRQLIARCAT